MDKKKVKYYNSIQFKLNISMFLFSVFLIVIIYIVFLIVNKKEIKESALNTSIISVKKINAQLKQKLDKIEVLALTLANVGKVLTSNDENNKKIIKNILDLKGYEQFIAGGGIWPEPYTLNPKKARNSYFFGKNRNEKFIFYNNYNSKNGNGYHNEEWYVAAKYYEKGKIYWSKSYIDQYSYEPMVTATAPIYKNNKFMGVATIDIMLDGLYNFLKNNSLDLNGYAFILDRNEKILSFPDKSISKINNDYITFEELGNKQSFYKNLNVLMNAKSNKELSQKYLNIASKLEKDSYKINKEDSLLIAKLIQSNNTKDKKNVVKSVIVHDDPILKKDVLAISLYQTQTNWNLIVMIPVDTVLSQSNRLFKNIMSVIIILIIFASLLAYLAIKKEIVKPIISMIKQLNHKLFIKLERDDEYGELAYWFNKKSQETIDMNNEIKLLMKTMDKHVVASETDSDGVITYVSEAFCKISGYEREELLGKKHNILRHPDTKDELYTDMWKTLKSNKTWIGEIKNKRKDGSYYWVHAIITPKCSDTTKRCGYTAIRYDITAKKEVEELKSNLEIKVQERTRQLENSKNEIEKAHKRIQDSISFASLIQEAILPQEQILKDNVKSFFTHWKPRDIVGGDIFFVTKLNQDELIVMVIDGAGHGVPGAFVTMLVKAIEAQIISDIKNGKLLPNPSNILEYFNKSIKTMLKQEKGSKSNMGFDGGVLYYNISTNICKYAGAKTPLYIINDDNLEVIKSDRKNVGFIRTKIDQRYTDHEISIKEETKLYISTDGIIDQEGANGTRFGKSKFEEILLNISKKDFNLQKKIIIQEYTSFQQEYKQSDDITVLGIQFK